MNDTRDQGRIIRWSRVVAWYAKFVLGQDIRSRIVEEGADGFGEAVEEVEEDHHDSGDVPPKTHLLLRIEVCRA